jgi:hypothetical protein
MIEPIRILLYCLFAGLGLTALWYALLWVGVPSLINRIITLIAAMLIAWWLLQRFGVA